jgi:glutamine synthetase
VHAHKRVLFDGDNYTDDWKEEAAKRGLPNLISTPEALAVLEEPATAELFGKYDVLSERELHSRCEVYKEAYEEIVSIEATCMVTMARTMLVPTAFGYARELAETAASLQAVKAPAETAASLACDVATHTETLAKAIDELSEADDSAARIALMVEARAAADHLESLVPAERWPLPSYADMMFLL